jgi:hypothetical protein
LRQHELASDRNEDTCQCEIDCSGCFHVRLLVEALIGLQPLVQAVRPQFIHGLQSGPWQRHSSAAPLTDAAASPSGLPAAVPWRDDNGARQKRATIFIFLASTFAN